jgi:peptide/nickel transport system substrate-binding protein
MRKPVATPARALAFLALVLYGCAPAPGPPATTTSSTSSQAGAPGAAGTTTTTADQPVRGGVLSWAYTTIPTKMDPVWSQARTDGVVLSQVVQGLTMPTNDGTGVQPGLSDNWTVSEDGLTYTFHLRPGVKFHNGKPVTPEDVIASLQRDQTMGTYKWTLENVQNMSKVDDQNVRITLGSKVASFLARLAVNSNAIFPAEEIAKVGQDEFTNPIGTGPFMVKEWVRGDHLTLDRNPNYWEMGSDGKPLPYLDGLEFRQVPEDSTKVLQIQASSLNGTEGLPWSQLSTLQSDSRGNVLLFPQQQIYFMVLNTTRPPFEDVNVRQAMSLALDRQVFVDRATAGKADVANSFMPKSGSCWNATSQLPYNLDKAKALMAQSRYPQGFSGAKLQLTSGGQIGRDNAVLAQDMWSKIGINVTIEEVEGSTLSNSWYKGDFDTISGYQWTNGMVDPEQLVIFFFVDPRMNTGYQPSQHATDLTKSASQELDATKRCQMYDELQDIYNQDVGGTITLYYTPSVNYLTPDVKNFVRTPLGVPLYKTTWLSK